MKQTIILILTCALGFSCGKKDDRPHTKDHRRGAFSPGDIFFTRNLEEGLRDEAARQHY